MIKMLPWLKQSIFYDIEIIIVNDVIDFADETHFAENSEILLKNVDSKKVKVLQGKFGNPGESRNAGINVAKGDWIVFWDADDQPNLKNLMNQIESTHNSNTEVIITQFQKIESETGSILLEPHLLSESELIHGLVNNLGIWRFAFRREVVGEKRFIKSRMGEDQVFLSLIGIFERHILFSTSTTYKYIVGNYSQLTLQNDAKEDLKVSIMKILENIKKQNGRNKVLSQYFFINLVMAAISNCRLPTKIFALKIFLKESFKNPRTFMYFVEVFCWKAL